MGKDIKQKSVKANTLAKIANLDTTLFCAPEAKKVEIEIASQPCLITMKTELTYPVTTLKAVGVACRELVDTSAGSSGISSSMTKYLSSKDRS